ncbi:MAG: DUF4363 family protein [Clostridia bacterium]|nr:DUF4363 family protein [Clostridia bacterium]
MKKMIIAITILAVILTAGILESIFVEKTFVELNSRLEIVIQYIVDDNVEAALKSNNDTIEWWEGKRHRMEMFTFSPDLRLLSVSLGESKGSLECGDMKSALSKTESILNISNNLREILNFNLQDII